MPLTREEINRKLLHILSGTMIPAGIFYIPQIPGGRPWHPPLILGVLTAVFVFLDVARFRMPAVKRLFYRISGPMMRKHEDETLTGATWIWASTLLCSLLFYNHRHVSAIVISLFIIGDAVAALVGISIGRIKIGKKSLEGSLACLALCLVMFYAVYPLVPGLLDAWGGCAPWQIVAVASLSTTVFELVPFKLSKDVAVNDNLTVPVITGLLILLTRRLIAA